MKKKAILCGFVIALMLSITVTAYAASEYTMKYFPGTADTVADLPPADKGTGGEAYTVSSQIPKRQGYEFIDWTLDYGVLYKLMYVVKPDPAWGTPEDSTVPVDPNQYASGNLVNVEDQLISSQNYAYNDKGEQIPGTWTFEPWDKDDFQIYEDSTITGGWTFTPAPITYSVTYVVNPDKIYDTPEGSTVPADPTKYAPGDTVDVENQLTTTVNYAYNEKGDKVSGTWEFVTWDKDDFQIYEDTTITGGWIFTPAPAKKYDYTVEYWLVDGTNLVEKVANDKPGTVDNLGDNVTEAAIPMGSKDLYARYRSPKKYRIKPHWESVTATITKDNYVIRIFYELIPKGQ